MAKLPVEYILTTFSVSMFGPKASIHLQELTLEAAKCLLGMNTKIVATRNTHEALAKRTFGEAIEVVRFADMTPDHSAIVMHYRGAALKDDEAVPEGSTITYYLVESEDFIEEEED